MFIDKTNHICIAMPIYNLIGYSDNYSDTSGSLQKFKRGEVPNNNADLTADNSQSFRYKAALWDEEWVSYWKCPSSWRFLNVLKALLKQLKMKQKSKWEDFHGCCWVF